MSTIGDHPSSKEQSHTFVDNIGVGAGDVTTEMSDVSAKDVHKAAKKDVETHAEEAQASVDAMNTRDAADLAGQVADVTDTGNADCVDGRKEQMASSSKKCHCEALNRALAIIRSAFDPIVAPVAGHCLFYWIHKALVAFSFVFFFVNLGILLDTYANSSVTEVELIMKDEIQFPDVYVCIPASQYYKNYRCCGASCSLSNSQCMGKLVPSWLYSTGGACNGLEMTTEVSRAETKGLHCPYTTYLGTGLADNLNLAAFSSTSVVPGCPFSSSTNCPAGQLPMPTGKQSALGAVPTYDDTVSYPTHEYATLLENKLNTYTPTTVQDGYSVFQQNPTKAVCFYYKLTNADQAKITRSGTQYYLTTAFVGDLAEQHLTDPMHFEIYMMEAGKAPADSTEILASKAVWPGLGTKGIGSISLDRYKDETKGETDWTYNFQIALTSIPDKLVYWTSTPGTTASKTDSSLGTTQTISPGDLDNGPLWGIISFTISNFVVRSVLVRDYTVAEVCARIGGLWVMSIMVISIFFHQTNISDKDHRLYYIFNFLSPKQRDEYLKKAEEDTYDEKKDEFLVIYDDLDKHGKLEPPSNRNL